MFVQIMQGRVKDAAALRRQWEAWESDLKPAAKGYLGGTSGVTDDGEFIAIARFESQEAARTNSDRPKQGEWWERTAACFDGDVTFQDCTDVEVDRGGSDRAGFVQVIQGRTSDEQRLRQLSKDFESREAEMRPDVIGSVTAYHGNGGFTTAVYFKSEAEAREGEARELPPELNELMATWQGLMEDVRYWDLKEPMFSSP